MAAAGAVEVFCEGMAPDCPDEQFVGSTKVQVEAFIKGAVWQKFRNAEPHVGVTRSHKGIDRAVVTKHMERVKRAAGAWAVRIVKNTDAEVQWVITTQTGVRAFFAFQQWNDVRGWGEIKTFPDKGERLAKEVGLFFAPMIVKHVKTQCNKWVIVGNVARVRLGKRKRVIVAVPDGAASLPHPFPEVFHRTWADVSGLERLVKSAVLGTHRVCKTNNFDGLELHPDFVTGLEKMGQELSAQGWMCGV